MSLVRPITRADIKGPHLYGPIRDDYRRHVIAAKRARRVLIGDCVSLVFENRHTLQVQIEEICRAEQLTSDEQIRSEIAIYNQLMPTESSLSATLFIELTDEADAKRALNRLIGLDEHVTLHIGAHAIRAAFEPGRATAERISAVQYTRFPLAEPARQALATPDTPLAIDIDHPHYRHRTACTEAMRASLADDYR